MDEQFAPLSDEAEVFRLARVGSRFLTRDQILPLPEWLIPSTGDREEGVRRGRPAGLSVWDRERTSLQQAKSFLTGEGDVRGFVIPIREARTVAERHSRQLAFVRDSICPRDPREGCDGHSLIEGLERPHGVLKTANKDLLSSLRDCCVPLNEKHPSEE